MQSFNHRGIYLIVYKHARGLGSRGEADGFLIQMRLEKTQFVERAICRVKKFAIVFFYAEDCDVHRLISAIGLATTNRGETWQQLRIDAHFFIRALADSPCKDEHFFKPPRPSR